ncbi:arsenate reductase (glutaredoxin) [Pseudooceanicola sp. C21-150M6]|uniref:arsenate reductase (glutaredoxin) n=1 Tax=Pseudooceanicola sp. C21-150M6 TaxID=3434355 RepID=UPI003D7F8FC2
MILWHNPRCTKSRQTLNLLEDYGIRPKIRPYLLDPPSEAELREVAEKLGVGPLGMMRTKEKAFKEMGLTINASNDALFAAMAAAPVLIERPILIAGDRAAIGRPPENVVPLLEEA